MILCSQIYLYTLDPVIEKCTSAFLTHCDMLSLCYSYLAFTLI